MPFKQTMSKNKRITIITGNYFPEDTAIGLYTTQFSKYLIDNGYQVKIITGFPNYPQWKIYEAYENLSSYYSETIDNIEIIRYKQYVPSKITLKGRVLMMLSLFYGTFINLRKIKNTDIVICIIPFTISIVPAFVLSKLKKAKLWIHIQDFEYDLALESGIIKGNNVFLYSFAKVISFLERKMLNTADQISSISYSMLAKIKEKSSHKEPYYFPNWVSDQKINPNSYSNHGFINSEKFTLLYSGNIGEKQDWSFLVALCEIIESTDNIEVVIVGNGGFKNNLLSRIEKFNFVKIYDSVPYHELNNLLCSTNIHFLFQKQEVVDTVMPSKILGMMASARPSIIVGNEKSEVFKIISESKGGYYFSKNEINELYDTILKLKNDRNWCEEIGVNARKYILTKFSEKLILSNFINEINLIR